MCKEDARYRADSLYRYGGSCQSSSSDSYNDSRSCDLSHPKMMAHIVKEHETLQDILEGFDMTMEEMLFYNRTNEMYLCPGRVILVRKN